MSGVACKRDVSAYDVVVCVAGRLGKPGSTKSQSEDLDSPVPKHDHHFCMRLELSFESVATLDSHILTLHAYLVDLTARGGSILDLRKIHE